MTEEYITVTEAAQITGLSIRTIQNHLGVGKLKGKRWGRDWMVERKSAENYQRTTRGKKPQKPGGNS